MVHPAGIDMDSISQFMTAAAFISFTDAGMTTDFT